MIDDLLDLWLDRYMNRTTYINGNLITTPAIAAEMGLEVPDFAADFDLIGFDSDNDVVAWGPFSEHDEIVRLIRVF